MREYLTSGAHKLIEYVLANAGEVMKQKQEQITAEMVTVDQGVTDPKSLDAFKKS